MVWHTRVDVDECVNDKRDAKLQQSVVIVQSVSGLSARPVAEVLVITGIGKYL